MITGKEQEKSQLAKEICELSTRATACANLHHPRKNKSAFINWYLVLKVDENADICSIRKQYHKLALQLHPDKNSNSKAETAFKLVSEAYSCLSDTARRRAFDAESSSISCIKCNPNSYKTDHTNVKIQKQSQETSRYNLLQTRMRELRNKLAEEATIIEKCLIANAASRKEHVNAHGARKETPIFDPSDYLHRSYPHPRTASHKRLEDIRAAIKIGNRSMNNNTAKHDEYPIFQYQSESVSSLSRCTSMRDC
ncbi:hypothetical protein C2S52_011399 [Perilla frutescens var. hirtella]|nr:hypothetical protein C2S52_011399 [Perilla frutescens var. hirtella]